MPSKNQDTQEELEVESTSTNTLVPCCDCHSLYLPTNLFPCVACTSLNCQYCLYTVDSNTFCSACYWDRYFTCSGCDEVRANNDYVENNIGTCCAQGPRFGGKYVMLPPTTFDRLTSKRRVGVELEFLTDDDDLLHSLQEYGEIKEDGSIRGNGIAAELASHSASGDRLLDLLDALSAKVSQGATVNKSCGFHVHLDMGETSEVQQERIKRWWRLCEPLLWDIVAPSRAANAYCAPYDPDSPGRYFTLNTSALKIHGTFEVRMHQGTTNPERIKAWVLFLVQFFDTLQDVPCSKVTANQVQRLSRRKQLIFFFQWLKLPLSLKKYWVSRIRRFDHQGKYAKTA